MSCKSALYAAMQTPTAVAVGGVIPLGGLIRRYGCDIALNGNAVNLAGTGYYDVDASITATLTAAGAVTATLYKDGVAVPGATATEIAQSLTDPKWREAIHQHTHKEGAMETSDIVDAIMLVIQLPRRANVTRILIQPTIDVAPMP